MGPADLEAQAKSELQNRGLVVNEEFVFTSDTNQRGRVLSQDPTDGTTVQAGQTVTIRIGSVR